MTDRFQATDAEITQRVADALRSFTARPEIAMLLSLLPTPVTDQQRDALRILMQAAISMGVVEGRSLMAKEMMLAFAADQKKP